MDDAEWSHLLTHDGHTELERNKMWFFHATEIWGLYVTTAQLSAAIQMHVWLMKNAGFVDHMSISSEQKYERQMYSLINTKTRLQYRVCKDLIPVLLSALSIQILRTYFPLIQILTLYHFLCQTYFIWKHITAYI